jgi:hypothetical protein
MIPHCYVFHDGNTSWLRVSRKTLQQLEITQNYFSKFTRVDFQFIYLGSDKDKQIFHQIFFNQTGSQPKIIQRNSPNIIKNKYRNYHIKEYAIT